MAFSGHTAPQVTINSSANANPYTGNITVGSTSDLVVLFIQGWTGTGGHDPTTWTVTVDGSAITPTHSRGSSAVNFAGAIYELTGLAAGARALSVSFGAAGRGCQAIAYVITGQDTTTPVAARNGNASYSGDVATLGFTTTTGANGNLLVSVMGNRENVAGAEYSMTGGTLIGSSTTGGVDTSDITAAYGYHEVATAGSTTDTYSWTDTGRCHVLWAEINLATGGGGVSVTTGTGSVTVQGHAPTAGAGATAATGTGAVAVQGYAPTATAGAGVSATPGTGSITVQGYAPTVATGGEATATPGTGTLTLQGHAPTATAGVTAATGTGSITVQGYAPTVSDGSVAETQPGGWLPIKYVDRDGNVVDLDAVEEAIEEIAEQAPPKRRADLTRVSARVLAMLARDETPRRDDVRLLRRALAEREAALMALNAALLAQQLLDDETTVLLLAA